MKYFETLSEADREALFAHMRAIDDESVRHHYEFLRLQPRHGEIAVGAGHFDVWLKYELAQEVLRQLRSGLEPVAAGEAAKFYGRECVRIHNAKRARDINWQRDLDTGSAYIDRLVARIPRATQ